MELWLALILFAVGLALLVKGGDWFVDAAGQLARAMGMPPFIVGATIVSLATTMPELIVSVMAAMAGKTDMAVGNAVGSVTANTAMIMALSMLFLPVAMPRRDYAVPCLLLVGAAGALHLGTRNGYLTFWGDIVLIIIFAAFIHQNIAVARTHRQELADDDAEPIYIVKNVGMFLLGAVGIVGGSRLLVTGGSAVAEALGVPERVIAVTMVAIGTSLPELVTAITAIRKKEAALSVGNIIGANIIDLSLILPLCSATSGRLLPVAASSMRLDMPMCLFVTALAIAPALLRQKAGKLQGAALLFVYGWYVLTII